MGVFASIFDFLAGSDRPSSTWDGGGRNWSHDWCRYRRKSHCHYPEHIDGVRSQTERRPIFYVKDQGHCPFVSEQDQRQCPGSEAGILSRGQSNVSIPWELGGQRMDRRTERAARAGMTVAQETWCRQAGLIREKAPLSVSPYAPCPISQGMIPPQYDPSAEPDRARQESAAELDHSRRNLQKESPTTQRQAEQLELALDRLRMLEATHTLLYGDHRQ